MEDGVDNDLRPADLEEHGVRESPKECPSHRAVDKLVSFRLASDRREAGVEGLKKIAGEKRALCVVPRVGIINIKLRFRGETEAPYLRRSSLARTSSQDFAAKGLRACTRRRLASSFRWASVTGMASGVTARLSQSSSINWSLSSTLRERARFNTVLMTAFSAGRFQAARPISADDDYPSDGSLGSPARRGPSRDRRRRRPAATSRGDDFLAHEVESDDTRELTLLEMASDRVADHIVKGRGAVSLREDRLAEGSGRETPFRSFFDQEDYL
jgi:hypothetical protein